jgi:glycosyltransferase involved in cell wall biosynthesis
MALARIVLPMVALSVVIPARNAAATLPAQLEALSSQAYRGDWELIVVDNGSTDATRRIATDAAAMSPIRVVDAGGQVGTNYARNAGATVAHGRFVLFVDADDVVAPGWLAAMARAAETADAVCGPLDRTMFTAPRDSLPGRERTTGLTVWPGFLPFATGANFGIRMSLLRELGGFDVTYSRGSDDVELSWRLQLRGYRVTFVPGAVVHYRERQSLCELARQFAHYGEQDPHLYRDFRATGMPAGSIRQGLRSWAHLLVRAPWYWWHPGRRRQWVRSASRRVGRIVGSVRWRTLYL